MSKTKIECEFFTPPQIAALCGRSVPWVIGEIKAGRLSAINFARPGAQKPRFRVHIDDWQAYVNRRRVSAKSAAPRRQTPAGVTQFV